MDKLDKVAKHWAVTVHANGEEILCIETNCLSGVENIRDHDETVRHCAEHLLSFIGDYRLNAACLTPAPGDVVEIVTAALRNCPIDIGVLGLSHYAESIVQALQSAGYTIKS